MDLSKRTGAIVSKIEPALDYILGSATQPFDWNKGFKCSYIPKAKDQSISSSCGGFAVSTLKEILDVQHQVKSPKFIYAQTHAVGGGTSVYALGNHLIKKGACSEALCPSEPATESNLTCSEDITKEMLYDGIKDLSTAYAQITTLRDIDSVACAIRDNDGCIIGITGANNGTWLSGNPQPPKDETYKWHHWVAGVGASIVNNKKTISFINSWGSEIGLGGVQYINEDYFTSGNIWCVWTVTEKENVIVPEFHYKWSKTMRFGQSSTDIKALQKALKLQGYNQLVTGYFGNMTWVNVKVFQSKHELVPDGIVGAKTIAVLNKLYA